MHELVVVLFGWGGRGEPLDGGRGRLMSKSIPAAKLSADNRHHSEESDQKFLMEKRGRNYSERNARDDLPNPALSPALIP